MPELNGFDLARALWEKDSDAKVCFMTAFEIYEEEANKVFKDFRTKCFLKKPMTVKGLIQHIENRHLKTDG
jgi:two-component SAPR family response regulator